MAEFAIASISSLALHNEQTSIAGNMPSLGSWIGTRPDFDWTVAFAIFVPIGILHLILLVMIIDAERFRRKPSLRDTELESLVH